MKISRYYIQENLIEKDILIKDKELIHRLFSVLKYKTGESVKLFSGKDDFDYVFEIKEIDKNSIYLGFLKKLSVENIISKKINAYACIVKSDFDEMLREMVELGVNSITPVISERVERKELNAGRLEKIIREACEQSGRVSVPSLEKTIKLKDFSNFSCKNICYHTEEVSQEENVTQEDLEVNIFIGPEGGWTTSEIEWFLSNNFEFRTLKTNVLRAKTASTICVYDALIFN